MRRLVTALLASLVLAGLLVPAIGTVTVAAADAVPKVVIVVGPSGAATDRYRREAREAAKLARRYTPDVTELYSPSATWPAVKAALQGASVVVYMGHGNGWPSRYRDSLFPPSQNGFGLNATAGDGDDRHQYFGEGPIGEQVELARNAVVLLNHLCYASGNSEPGLAEGTLEQARQRVDNYAAGFIRAGAAAVVAEAYASPNHMLRSVLGGGRSIEAAWRGAPSRNGNAFAFGSARSEGYLVQMDPERGSSGFSRSIVLKAGLASTDVLRNARGSAAAAAAGIEIEPPPSLAAARITAAAPELTRTTAGARLTYRLPYEVGNRKALPDRIMASARWDALDAAPVEASTDPAASAEPDLGLVIAERPGAVVEPVEVKLFNASLGFKLQAPAAPGRYRLTVTLHDADGVAFDAAAQALFPALIVRVTGDLDARIVAPATTEVVRGAATTLPLWVSNVGVGAWGHGAITDAKDPEATSPAMRASVIGQWIALGAGDAEQLAAAAAASVTAADLPAGLESGAVVPADLGIFAPSIPGDYLLLLDIQTPEHGSLVAAGVEPTVIRVRVLADAPTPAVEAAPDASSIPAGAVEPAPVPADGAAVVVEASAAQ